MSSAQHAASLRPGRTSLGLPLGSGSPARLQGPRQGPSLRSAQGWTPGLDESCQTHPAPSAQMRTTEQPPPSDLPTNSVPALLDLLPASCILPESFLTSHDLPDLPCSAGKATITLPHSCHTGPLNLHTNLTPRFVSSVHVHAPPDNVVTSSTTCVSLVSNVFPIVRAMSESLNVCHSESGRPRLPSNVRQGR